MIICEPNKFVGESTTACRCCSPRRTSNLGSAARPGGAADACPRGRAAKVAGIEAREQFERA